MAIDKLAGLNERHRRQAVIGNVGKKVDYVLDMFGARRSVRHDRRGVLHRIAYSAKRVWPACNRIIETTAVVPPGHVLCAECVADGGYIRRRNEEEVAAVRRRREVGW